MCLLYAGPVFFPQTRELTISVCPSTGPPELFDAWLSQFCLEEKKGEISELLVGSPSIRALYTKMVRAQLAGPQPAPSLRCREVGETYPESFQSHLA